MPRDLLKIIEIASYNKMTFNMVGGKETSVKLRFYYGFAGEMIDRFG